MIAAHAVLALEMADDGLDRRTASHVTLDLRCHAPLLAGGIDPKPVIGRSGMAAITGIGEDAFEPVADQSFNDWDDLGQVCPS